jgi:hypothetical protein
MAKRGVSSRVAPRAAPPSVYSDDVSERRSYDSYDHKGVRERGDRGGVASRDSRSNRSRSDASVSVASSGGGAMRGRRPAAVVAAAPRPRDYSVRDDASTVRWDDDASVWDDGRSARRSVDVSGAARWRPLRQCFMSRVCV